MASMTYKTNLTNSVRSGSGSFRQNSVHEKLHSTPSTEEKIKFAGDESKDRLYEPKQNKKMVRVLTVVIYIFSVSLAAIILSLYYVFFWKPPKTNVKIVAMPVDNVTNTMPTALPRCLSHDPNNNRVSDPETATFPFQIDNPFDNNNTTETVSGSPSSPSSSTEHVEDVTPSQHNAPVLRDKPDSSTSSILLTKLSRNLYKKIVAVNV